MLTLFFAPQVRLEVRDRLKDAPLGKYGRGLGFQRQICHSQI